MMLRKAIIACFFMFIPAIVFSAASNDQAQSDALSKTKFPADYISSDVSTSMDRDMPAQQYLQLNNESFDKKDYLFKVETALHQLKFYSGKSSKHDASALKNEMMQFQQSLGDSQTGQLTIGELQQLIQRTQAVAPDKFHPVEIYPEKFIFEVSDDSVLTRGTWVALDFGRGYNNIETSEIRCLREQEKCLEATAFIMDDKAQTTADYDYLTVSTTYWDITRWDETEVIAENNSHDCVNFTLSMNLSSQQVLMQYRYKNAKSCKHSSDLAPHTEQLIDGATFAKQFYHQQNKQRQQAYNPRYLEKLKQRPLN